MIAIGFVVAFAANASFGVPVVVPDSPLQVVSVFSRWRGNPVIDYNITFDDCAQVSPIGSDIKQFEIGFALSNNAGELRGRVLSVVVQSKEARSFNAGTDICLSHGYENGYKGDWLISWVNRIVFVDGSIWDAPSQSEMAGPIAESIPKKST